MSKTFYGTKKMRRDGYYCEAMWHDETTPEPRGPLRMDGFDISVDAVTNDGKHREMRVAGGADRVFLDWPDGTIRPLPARACGRCLKVLEAVLRPDQVSGQESLL